MVSVGFSFALIETFQTMAIPYSMLAGGFISLLMAVKFNFRIMPLKLDLQLILSSLGFIAIAAIFTALAEFNLQFARLALAIVGLLAIAIISKNLLFSKQHGIVK